MSETFFSRRKPTEHTFVDTPRGIFTSKGNWFRTTEKDLNKYAGPLFEKVDLGKVLASAEVWIKGSDSISLIVFMAVLHFLGWIVAVPLGIAFFALFYLNKSAFATPLFGRLVAVLSTDVSVLAVSVVVLSGQGMAGHYVALAIGFIFFMLFKFGLIRKGFSGYVIPKLKMKTSLNDRLLRQVIVRTALAKGIVMPELEIWTGDIMKVAGPRK